MGEEKEKSKKMACAEEHVRAHAREEDVVVGMVTAEKNTKERAQLESGKRNDGREGQLTEINKATEKKLRRERTGR